MQPQHMYDMTARDTAHAQLNFCGSEFGISMQQRRSGIMILDFWIFGFLILHSSKRIRWPSKIAVQSMVPKIHRAWNTDDDSFVKTSSSLS